MSTYHEWIGLPNVCGNVRVRQPGQLEPIKILRQTVERSWDDDADEARIERLRVFE